MRTGFNRILLFQPAGTSLSVVFTATDEDIGDSFTYSIVSSSYSSNFKLITIPVPHLETAIVFDYETMSPTTFQIR